NSFVLDSKTSDYCDRYDHVVSYPKTNSWDNVMDCYSWDGLTCDSATGNVIGLDLTCSRLHGILQSNSSLFLLRHLRSLNLSNNNFACSHIPPNMSAFAKLTHLNLSYSHFLGTIPSEISRLSKLVSLDLSYNCISTICSFSYLRLENSAFAMLVQNLTTLRKLVLNHVDMSMISEEISMWFSEIGHDTLEILDLYGNLLEGGIQWLHRKSLQYIFIENNSFYGPLSNNGFTDLSGNKLQGPLPRSLVKCVNLLVLVLSHNEFNDIFPHRLEASQLSFLDPQSNKFHGGINLTAFRLSFPALQVLVISNNNFIGRWPMEFFSNTSLAILDLSRNKFEGPIPLPSSVTFYYAIASNNMTGKIPSSICNFTKLKIIDLSNNSLTGSLLQCLTNFSTVLSVLNLQKNYLEGTIPQSFSSRSSLTTLDLSQNHFEGTLPRSLVKCSHMEVLDLSDNQIENTFPRWFGTLPELRVLILRSNNLKGLLNIPGGEHLFLKLHILDLSNNNFSGPLLGNLIMSLRAIVIGKNGQDKSLYMTQYLGKQSTRSKLYENSMTLTMKGREFKLVKILTFLTIIDLSHNSFQGQIPEVIGHLHSLVGLNLSHNHLTGSIPLTLGNLTNLGWLDFSSNNLSGIILGKLGDLAFLGYLNLSKNQLIGRISQDKQLSTFSSDSFSGNPGLCGTPLPKACLGDAQSPSPSSSSTFDREGHESWFK
ncbi:hypothetical protein EUGRSUZ_F00709, partial [Eucalyptus grandis]